MINQSKRSFDDKLLVACKDRYGTEDGRRKTTTEDGCACGQKTELDTHTAPNCQSVSDWIKIELCSAAVEDAAVTSQNFCVASQSKASESDWK